MESTSIAPQKVAEPNVSDYIFTCKMNSALTYLTPENAHQSYPQSMPPYKYPESYQYTVLGKFTPHEAAAIMDNLIIFKKTCKKATHIHNLAALKLADENGSFGIVAYLILEDKKYFLTQEDRALLVAYLKNNNGNKIFDEWIEYCRKWTPMKKLLFPDVWRDVNSYFPSGN